MEDKVTIVDKQFPKFNCAQTVLSLFAKETGLKEKTALKIASGFGGGMACAGTCGAVTGSYMVIGMKHGHSEPVPEAKAKTKRLIEQFNKLFIAAHGTLICKELTGFDISTPEGYSAAHENNIFNTKCPHFIKTACNILQKNF